MRDISFQRRTYLIVLALAIVVVTGSLLLARDRGRVSANPLTDIVAVAAGGNHTCALNAAGGVLCWGDNHYGELGDGTSTDRSRPVAVTELPSGVEAIAAGYNHTCALLDTGGVKCWGYNRYGQLGNVQNFGDVFAANPGPLDVMGLDAGVAAISLGAAHSCALLESGAVKCWGWNQRGQVGRPLTDCTRCANPTTVVGLAGVSLIDSGAHHTCALSGGSVDCWGQNESGQLGADTGSPCVDETLEPLACSPAPVEVDGLSNVIAVSAGGIDIGGTGTSVEQSHTCAVLSSGGVKCWGANASGQLGDDQACGQVCQSPVDVVDLNGDPVTGAVDVSLGGQHSCYRDGENGRVYCWGEGSDGQIGNGVVVDRPRANEVCANLACAELNDAAAVSLGLGHACALVDGGLICWGSNSNGQLGDGGGCGTTCSAPVGVSSSKGDLPDLVVQTVRIELETGGSCAFTSTNLGTRIEFRNIGTADAGLFVVEVNGAQLTYSDGLAAGVSGDVWFPGNNYPGPTDALLDATFLVTESNEDNNAFSQSVPIPTLPPTCTPTRTVTPAPPTATPTPSAAEGDANCDGSVNSIDAALVLQRVAGLLQMLACQGAADANDDGDIDSIDAALILQFVAGLLDHL